MIIEPSEFDWSADIGNGRSIESFFDDIYPDIKESLIGAQPLYWYVTPNRTLHVIHKARLDRDNNPYGDGLWSSSYHIYDERPSMTGWLKNLNMDKVVPTFESFLNESAGKYQVALFDNEGELVTDISLANKILAKYGVNVADDDIVDDESGLYLMPLKPKHKKELSSEGWLEVELPDGRFEAEEY